MKRFEKLFLETTKEPFSFLSVNFDAKGVHQFTKNFNTLIITEEDLNQQILNFE